MNKFWKSVLGVLCIVFALVMLVQFFKIREEFCVKPILFQYLKNTDRLNHGDLHNGMIDLHKFLLHDYLGEILNRRNNLTDCIITIKSRLIFPIEVSPLTSK